MGGGMNAGKYACLEFNIFVDRSRRNGAEIRYR